MANPDGYLVFQTAIDESGFNDGVDDITKSAKGATKGIEALASVLSAAGITATAKEIAEALYDCSEAASAFETGVSKVMTIADGSKASLESMKSSIMELSADLGVEANELSESTYQAISASVDTAEAVDVVRDASKLAVGGFTDTATAIDILTTAMNAYGMGTDQVTRISDVLVTTQNLGKTSVGEVAGAMGKVIPLAAAYGMEIENLSSAYAVLTANGIKTDEATTYIKAALNELGDSGSTVGKILKEKTGKGFSELTKEGKSLGDITSRFIQSRLRMILRMRNRRQRRQKRRRQQRRQRRRQPKKRRQKLRQQRPMQKQQHGRQKRLRQRQKQRRQRPKKQRQRQMQIKQS